jgi:hypothetical protein
MAAQFVASRVVLSSTELVSYHKNTERRNNEGGLESLNKTHAATTRCYRDARHVAGDADNTLWRRVIPWC